MKILDAVQECSGLRVRVQWRTHPCYPECGDPWFNECADCDAPHWLNPPVPGLSREEAERLIEEAGITVQGRMK